MKIGIIGAGQIGAALIRQYTKAGHQVKMTNASGIENLKSLAVETGAKAVSLNEVIKNIEVLVISIPFKEIPNLADSISQEISDETIIIDTTNYYPIRDGKIEEVENGKLESIWVTEQLSQPVLKVYNSILAGSLVQKALPNGYENRIALPVSGDNKKSKETIALLVNDSGFDVMDIGNLTNSWKQQPGSPIYCTDLNLSELKLNVDKAEINVLPERREMALQFILKQNPENWLGWYKDCVSNNRSVYKTALN